MLNWSKVGRVALVIALSSTFGLCAGRGKGKGSSPKASRRKSSAIQTSSKGTQATENQDAESPNSGSPKAGLRQLQPFFEALRIAQSLEDKGQLSQAWEVSNNAVEGQRKLGREEEGSFLNKAHRRGFLTHLDRVNRLEKVWYNVLQDA